MHVNTNWGEVFTLAHACSRLLTLADLLFEPTEFLFGPTEALFGPMLTLAHACSRSPTFFLNPPSFFLDPPRLFLDPCSRLLTLAHACSRSLTLAHACRCLPITNDQKCRYAYTSPSIASGPELLKASHHCQNYCYHGLLKTAACHSIGLCWCQMSMSFLDTRVQKEHKMDYAEDVPF